MPIDVAFTPAERLSARVGIVVDVIRATSSIAQALSAGYERVLCCREIEEARCNQAPACGIPIEPPHFTSGSTVDACIRYYDDACLHGLAVGDPGPTAVNACVAAIHGDSMKKDDCGIVNEPQTDTAACGWLVPPVSGPSDASSDGGVVVFDSATD